jgi:diguanylate cyclase (GGDEF)-like protein
MPGSVVESASIVAERIRERIEHYRPADPSLAGLHLTASIGLAVSMSGLSGREFIARADHALYLAKRDGKNRVRVHDEEPKGLEGEIDG